MLSFSFRGIPVVVSPWVLLTCAFFTFDAVFYIKKMCHKGDTKCYIVPGIIVALITIGCVILHEFGHGVVAYAWGDKVIKAGVTGWGAYVQTGVPLSDTSPLREITIAIAGPLVNLIIAAIAALFVWMMGESKSENSIQYVSTINIRLAWINMIPLYILDGGKVLHGMIWGVTGNSNSALTIGLVMGIAIIVIVRNLWRSRKWRNPEAFLETL